MQSRVQTILLAASVARCGALTTRRASRALSSPRPKAKQSLGQNWLQDAAIAQRIAESVGVGEDVGEGGCRVVELGPGQGAITKWLLAQHPAMTAVEIDERLIGVLRQELPQLALREGDLLQLDLARLADECGGRLALVSNTPYYLTSPLLFKLLGSLEHVESAVLTTQREVREKILARPGTKQYGILSVMLQLFASPRHLFDIPPEAFSPAPKVDSSVIRLAPSATPAGLAAPLSPARRADLLALLKITFESRRKMLRTSLKPLLIGLGAESTEPILASCLERRPEQLSPEEWLDLVERLFGAEADGRAAELLARGHASKSWRPHKAGYVD